MMSLYQRWRPSPNIVVRRHERRQDLKVEDGTDSPDSPQTSAASSLSPNSPSPTKSMFPGRLPPPAQTDEASPGQLSTATEPSAVTIQTSTVSPPPSRPPPPPLPPLSRIASTKSQEQTSTSASVAPSSQITGATPSSSVQTTTRLSLAVAPAQTSLPGTSAAGTRTTAGSSNTTVAASSANSAPAANSQPPSSANKLTGQVGSSLSTSISTSTIPAQSELAGQGIGIGDSQPQRSQKQDGGHMSKGAEAALITSAVLGFVALAVGAFIFFKRRRRRRSELGLRHAEDAFNPSNSGSLHAPETAHLGFGSSDDYDTSDQRATKMTMNSNSLFGSSQYQRPETVSTRDGGSRIAPAQPTPNPFADPPRNKAFDQLRGRPRSTTLTDRGSWMKNPFKDPESVRFDPFGEMQEKARRERVKYVEDVRREDEEKRRREREQEVLEKERMGLGVPEKARNGSGVTIEGVGVLDRSGGNAFR